MNDIESKLKRLTPNAGSLDRDALLYSAAFAAGRSAGRKPWLRLSVILSLALVVVTFAWALTNRLPPLPLHAITPAEAPKAETPARPEPYQLEPTSYIALMQHLGEYRPTTVEGSNEQPHPPLTPRSRID